MFIYLKITTFKISHTKHATNCNIPCKIKPKKKRKKKKTKAADNIERKIAAIVAYNQALCAQIVKQKPGGGKNKGKLQQQP